MKKQVLYGMLGFLSLLGFVGVFTEARGFLGFFAFAVDFQYFFLKSDEMLEEQLARSASRAFVAGMLVMAAAVLGTLTLGGFDPDRNVTRQELAVLLTRYDQYKGVTLVEGALNLFYDANQISSWAKEGVQHAVGMGWLEGSEGKINPNGVASRAQLAVLLERMATPAMG